MSRFCRNKREMNKVSKKYYIYYCKILEQQNNTWCNAVAFHNALCGTEEQFTSMCGVWKVKQMLYIINPTFKVFRSTWCLLRSKSQLYSAQTSVTGLAQGMPHVEQPTLGLVLLNNSLSCWLKCFINNYENQQWFWF